MSRSRPQYGNRPKEQVKPVNPEIRQYFDPDLPIYGPWRLWQTKPELPSSEEIMGTDTPGDVVALTANCISGPWISKEKYLEAHYSLIREDLVAPLRNAVAHVRDNPSMKDTADVSIYEKVIIIILTLLFSSKVFIVGVTLARSGLAFHLQFSTRRAGKNISWAYSNRLTPGTIVALTPKLNAFSSKCVVAVVACRLLEGVEKNPPEVDIFLASSGDIEVDPQQEWIMVEARTGYFEANRHTLTALQKLSKESFPLNEQICSLAKDIDAPEYINTAPSMDFTPLCESSTLDVTRKYDILKRWPSHPMGKLDESQWSALNRMLTKRLAIIQGPPGTGKTFTSIAALRMMLSNKDPKDPPIIIAAQTNHALDQLIKHISVFEKNFVRLGGRTSDPEIRRRTPFEIRQTQVPLTIDGASLFLDHNLLSQDQIDSLQETANKWQQSNTPANADPLAAWLADSVREFDYEYAGDFGFVDDDIDLEYEQLKETEVEHGKYEEDCSSSARMSRTNVKKLLTEKDLYKIHKRHRGAVYDYLREQLIENLGKPMKDLAQTYQGCVTNYQIGRFERDYCILQEAKIIGMTTTGLSKYRGLVSSLNPRVILIEEAAEVLEAPVAVACLPSLQHLILVGDHQQLKGQCAEYGLTGDPFYLDVSMFERLMLNEMPYAMLQEQRRMVPEIRRLVAPIYGDILRDHPSVKDHPLVPGMGDKRSFFFDHTAHESNDSLSSKVNDFEASMVVKLLAYLVMNNVPPASITVLTFYNGQRKLIMRKKSQDQNLSMVYINILTVDSYQGEENDIVILSLVRSNDHRGIGFLAQDNRACVALSRAKYGLYIFGNAQCVSQHSGFWHSVINVMSENQQEPRIGPALPLHCTRHNQETLIQTLKDWNTITDGCNKPCGKYLPCGHPCPRKCHGSEHDWVSCKQRCQEIRRCCNTPCICVCSPPHAHDCFCGMGNDSKTQIFDAGSDRDDSDRDDDHGEKVGPITRRSRPRAPTHPATSTTDEEAMRCAKGVSRWQAFAQGGALLDDYRRAGLTIGGQRPEKDVVPVKPTVGDAVVDDHRRTGLIVSGKRPEKDVVPVKPSVGDAVVDDHRQTGLVVSGKRPEKDVVPVKPSVAAPVEGLLINFDDDDDCQQVPATEKTQPAAPATEDLLTHYGADLAEATSELQDTLPIPHEKDPMTFEEHDHSRAGGASLGEDPLTVVVCDNDSASSPIPAKVLPTPMVEEVETPPMEGQLVDLS
ncbi:hypothetical protein N7516_001618 [Penicillium verrucosum]|uniref:uncharacterized protein n=1 Tax=Penicillium verrucosum TaxID=60171 RepID=UPI0025457B6A|nr:uncharacterized protein N7516_001618 [Penicillium verrucosum]KAJ5941450.1 hypothetical protein N7516_001618 [Penicillium verrucosum]